MYTDIVWVLTGKVVRVALLQVMAAVVTLHHGAAAMAQDQYVAQVLEIEVTALGDASNVFGQTFVGPMTPGSNEDDSTPPTLKITSFQVFSGGMNVGSPLTRLALVGGQKVPIRGFGFENPEGNVELHLIGISSNAVDMKSAQYGDPLLFDFDVILDQGKNYSAVFVEVDENGNMNPVEVSVAYVRFHQNESGKYEPTAGTTDKAGLESAALFADFNNDNLLDFAGDDSDICFVASYHLLHADANAEEPQ